MRSPPSRRSDASHARRTYQGVTSVAVSWRAVLVEDVAELGRHDHLVAAAGEGGAEHPLAVAGPVDVGGVEAGHAELQGAPDRAFGLGVVHLAPAERLAVGPPERAADRPAAEAHRADPDPAVAEGSCLHVGSLLPSPGGVDGGYVEGAARSLVCGSGSPRSAGSPTGPPPRR
jgi:hypothetical protein